MKHIFLTPDRRETWKMALAAEDPTALSILNFLKKEEPDHSDSGNPNANDRAEAMNTAVNQICLAWLQDDPDLAENGRQKLVDLLNDFNGADLGKAANALAAVLAWDFGAALWSVANRKAFADSLARIAHSFLDVTNGNPHIVTNNWWMLTHGGCLLACITVDGEDGTDGPIDLSDLKTWAFERFKAFCSMFGNAGLYHEGSGYIAYTLSMLMPALAAVQRHIDADILDALPQMRLSIASMLVGTAPFEHRDNGSELPTFGASLQWNDTGRGCLPLNPFIPGIAVSPPEWQGALRAWFDRLIGVDTRANWNCPYRGIPLTIALYPFSATREEPESVLPKQVVDQRQGLGMWRSHWGNGTESVFGWYARSTHAGGHAQDDAASIRLMALGRTWICGGGQARAKAEWQSVFTHAKAGDRPKPPPLAHMTCCQLSETAGVVGMDTRKSLGAYSERYLSWRSDLGYPFVLAVMDLLDDHVNPARDWQWNLSFPRELVSRVHEDGAGFTLADKGKGRLSARFLIDVPLSIKVKEMPPSSRTYSNERKVDYPGDRFIHAEFPNWKQARILVALAVDAPDKDLDPEMAFAENAIHLDGKEWEHPFSPAILKSVDLAQSVPNRMTLPAG